MEGRKKAEDHISEEGDRDNSGTELEEVGKYTTSSFTGRIYEMSVKKETIAILSKATTLTADKETAVRKAIVKEMFGAFQHPVSFRRNRTN